jgi:type IV fimbrial biogenesis protein FimT
MHQLPTPPFPSASLPRRLRRPRAGFTLVELMITLAVAVVLLAVAGPSMQEFTASNQLVTTKSGFASAVALARTEAAKRGRLVVLQALGSGPTGNEFANGWEIAVDDDGSGDVSATETRVRKNAAALQKVRLGGATQVAFRATGALVGTAAQVYTLCRSGGNRGYTVTVLPSGATDVAEITTCTP